MLNVGAETNRHMNNNFFNENYGHRNCLPYTLRQIQSAFIAPTSIEFQQSVVPLTQVQEQFQSLHVMQQHYPEQAIPSLPLNAETSTIQTDSSMSSVELQNQEVISIENSSATQQCQSYESTISSTINYSEKEQASKQIIGSDSSSSANINLNEISTSTKTIVTDDSEIKTTTPLIYDLQKYKYDYFLSKFSYPSDPHSITLGKPTGICTLNDDRLLVANYDYNSLMLVDINGVVYHTYDNILAPKDVLYYSSNPSQAVVATRKEVIILDLNTSQAVVKSNLKGFYPWNIQYIKEYDIFAACDPSDERVVFFDKNLADIGTFTLNAQSEQVSNQSHSQSYAKVYPYAAYFLPDDTSFILSCREDKFQLREIDNIKGGTKSICALPPTLKSYSIYVDRTKTCLIPDQVNHCLISIDKDSKTEIFKYNSIQEPYSMAFLSTGTLCVTDHNQSHGTNGGIAIISEINLKTNNGNR